jgi:hypothetical protein
VRVIGPAAQQPLAFGLGFQTTGSQGMQELDTQAVELAYLPTLQPGQAQHLSGSDGAR